MYRSVLFLLTILAVPPVFGQNPPPPGPSQSPARNPALRQQPEAQGQPSPRRLTPQEAQQLQANVGRAADRVLARVQKEENDLFLRFSYFAKAERLDPNTYASKDEIAEWQKLLQQMKERQQSVSSLYENAAKDLDNSLAMERIDRDTATKVKKMIVDGIPWETVKKKDQLMAQYVKDHGELLALYDRHWASWKPGDEPNQPVFTDPKLAASYEKLRTDILNTGNQIRAEYKAMAEE
jgi:hypothetical protein